MTHHDAQTGHSTRPLSRRLHRRLAVGVESACARRVEQPAMAPQVIGGLPQSVVREAGMFELLAAEMRIAELEKALAEARAQACTDPLTGALNRRGFDLACQREQARAQRVGKRLALAHIDLDDFKRLNDTLGHQAGDRVLVRLVELLHRSMRPSDLLCRFGGEEFVLMLPVNAVDEAVAALSRFLREFSALRVAGAKQAMSFSSGVTLLRPEEPFAQAIARADAAT